VKLRSVFLREECVLPKRLDPLREPIADGWMRVEEIPAPVFDTMIRQAGWHFMWIQCPSTRRGFGTTPEGATRRALDGALRGVSQRFNAAELDSFQLAKYPGFYIANVRLQARQIQEHTSLDNVDEEHSSVLRTR
jgi:hypothetical protein